MAEKVKVTALKTFGLGGKVYTPGPQEVPAEKVERLTQRGLIAPSGGRKSAGEGAAQTGEVTQPETSSAPLPEDFPARELLAAENITTYEQAREKTKTQLIAFDGIGPATADKILKALEESE